MSDVNIIEQENGILVVDLDDYNALKSALDAEQAKVKKLVEALKYGIGGVQNDLISRNLPPDEYTDKSSLGVMIKALKEVGEM